MRIEIRNDILRNGLVCLIPCSGSHEAGRPIWTTSLSSLTWKGVPWPLSLKLEFDPYPWYLITPASYLSTNWNSDPDSKNYPVSSSGFNYPEASLYGERKGVRELLQFTLSIFRVFATILHFIIFTKLHTSYHLFNQLQSSRDLALYRGKEYWRFLFSFSSYIKIFYSKKTVYVT